MSESYASLTFRGMPVYWDPPERDPEVSGLPIHWEPAAGECLEAACRRSHQRISFCVFGDEGRPIHFLCGRYHYIDTPEARICF